MFVSADRRWLVENIITRYQMTILVEALWAEPFVRGQAAGAFS